ncbi:MAG: peptide-methionine (S)-S-oxide reductase MsrA [Bdellovibrionota bacterium]
MNVETAVFAGGCFWGMEQLFRSLGGVVDTEVGYTGGESKNPDYKQVSSGQTGHAEALLVKFDPLKISYENLLLYFFKIHDPTTMNKQGNDVGSQYRSALFYMDENQKSTAQKIINKVNDSKAWNSTIVTELVPAQTFYRAEDFHQDYLEKVPQGYTCHYLRPLKF